MHSSPTLHGVSQVSSARHRFFFLSIYFFMILFILFIAHYIKPSTRVFSVQKFSQNKQNKKDVCYYICMSYYMSIFFLSNSLTTVISWKCYIQALHGQSHVTITILLCASVFFSFFSNFFQGVFHYCIIILIRLKSGLLLSQHSGVIGLQKIIKGCFPMCVSQLLFKKRFGK